MTSEVMKALIDAEEERHRSFTPKGTLHLTRTLPAQEKEKHKFGICIIFSFASFPNGKGQGAQRPDRHCGMTREKAGQGKRKKRGPRGPARSPGKEGKN